MPAQNPAPRDSASAAAQYRNSFDPRGYSRAAGAAPWIAMAYGPPSDGTARETGDAGLSGDCGSSSHARIVCAGVVFDFRAPLFRAVLVFAVVERLRGLGMIRLLRVVPGLKARPAKTRQSRPS